MTPESGAAVITGAASGIGLALARRLIAARVPVVMVDRHADRLSQARESVTDRQASAHVEIATVDVADPCAMHELADWVVSRFGVVGLLCNNAGIIGRPAPLWQQSFEDVAAVYDTNVLGLVNGIRCFVPRMVAANYGHVLNTCSRAGFTTSGMIAPYCSSKHAALALSECLAHDLRVVGSNVSVSVLCPGWVRTGFIAEPACESTQALQRWLEHVRAAIDHGADPDYVADLALRGVLAGRFYIVTNHDDLADLHQRVAGIERGVLAAGVRIKDANSASERQ